MRFSLTVVCLTFPVLTAVGQGEGRRAEELVEMLGSPRFAEREAAEKELLRLGAAALPAVRAGLKSADAEVRSRCKQLLGPLERQEWKRKADAYAADLRGERRHDLPLREVYEKLAGTGPSARKLFAECVRTSGPLLGLAAAGRSPALEAYQARCRELYALPKAPAGDLAALLLVSAALKDPAPDWRVPTGCAYLLGNPGLRAAVADRETGAAFRRLLVAWAEGRGADDVVSQQSFLSFVLAEGFKEGLPVVRRLIRDPKATPVNVRATAVAVLKEVGGKDAAGELMKLWGDETVLCNSPDGHKVRLGDQALAASMRLAGKDPKGDGMAKLDLTLKAPGSQSWQAPLYWFPSDDGRRAALKKWQGQAGRRE
jgi:hypothetical protein